MTAELRRIAGGRRIDGNGPNGNDDLRERVIAIETEMNHLATKRDIEEIKTLISDKENAQLKWLIGLIVIGLFSMGTAIVRSFY